jgi:hypothetical protein
MTIRRIIAISVAVTLIVISRLILASHVTTQVTDPIRRIDHIMVRTDTPANLYSFLTETLRLPVAWPLATRGGVTSGGVGFGNVNVEAIQFPGQQPTGAHLVGFGFEPVPLAQCLAELDRRGIKYGEVRPFSSTDPVGSKKTLFTNVTLLQFSDSDRPAGATMHIFLSEYSPTYVDVGQRHERLRRELLMTGGGPLGVKAVKEVIIGAMDLKAATVLWGRLLELRRTSAPGLWEVGDGPAIHVVQSGENKLQGLVISVTSLRSAKAFLQERGLLGSASMEELTIDPSKIQGLNMRLVEQK